MNCLWCKNMGMCNCVRDHHTGYNSSTSECYTYLQMDLLRFLEWSCCTLGRSRLKEQGCLHFRSRSPYVLWYKHHLGLSSGFVVVVFCDWEGALWSFLELCCEPPSLCLLLLLPLFLVLSFHTRQASLDLVQSEHWILIKRHRHRREKTEIAIVKKD